MPASLTKTVTKHRNIDVIALDIIKDWNNIKYKAKPYLQVMLSLETITDTYMYDSARSIVAYFLSNAGSYRGELAKQYKAELKAILKQ